MQRIHCFSEQDNRNEDESNYPQELVYCASENEEILPYVYNPYANPYSEQSAQREQEHINAEYVYDGHISSKGFHSWALQTQLPSVMTARLTKEMEAHGSTREEISYGLAQSSWLVDRSQQPNQSMISHISDEPLDSTEDGELGRHIQRGDLYAESQDGGNAYTKAENAHDDDHLCTEEGQGLNNSEGMHREQFAQQYVGSEDFTLNGSNFSGVQGMGQEPSMDNAHGTGFAQIPLDDETESYDDRNGYMHDEQHLDGDQRGPPMLLFQPSSTSPSRRVQADDTASLSELASSTHAKTLQMIEIEELKHEYELKLAGWFKINCFVFFAF
jgi:hypothetical protein